MAMTYQPHPRLLYFNPHLTQPLFLNNIKQRNKNKDKHLHSPVFKEEPKKSPSPPPPPPVGAPPPPDGNPRYIMLGTANNSVAVSCGNNNSSIVHSSSSSSSSSSSGSGKGRSSSSRNEPRKVYCPQCKTLLIEPPSCAIYSCSNCSQLLIAKHALRSRLGAGSGPPLTENQVREEDRPSFDGRSSEIPPPLARQLRRKPDGTTYNDADEGEVPDFDPSSSGNKVRRSPDSVLHSSPPPSNPASAQDQYDATTSSAVAECSITAQIKEIRDDNDGGSLTRDGSSPDREKYSRDDSFHFNVPAADLSSSEQMDMTALSSTEAVILHHSLEHKEDDASDRAESEDDSVNREASFDEWNQHGAHRTSPYQLEDPMGSIAISEEENEEDEGTDCDTNDEDENDDDDEDEDGDVNEDVDDKAIAKVDDADDDNDGIQEPIVFPILSAMDGNSESLDDPLEGTGYGLKVPSETENIDPAIDSPNFHLEHESDAEEAIPESSVDTSPWNSPPKLLSVVTPQPDVDDLPSNSFKGTGVDNSVLASKDSGEFLLNVLLEPNDNLAEEVSNINQPKESSNKAKSSIEPQILNGRDKEELESPDEAEPRNVHNFDLETNDKKGDIIGSSLPSQTQQSLNLNPFGTTGGDIDSTNYHLCNGSPRTQQHPVNNLSEGDGFAFRMDSEPGISAEEPYNNKENQLNEYLSVPQILNGQVLEQLVAPDEAEPEDIYNFGRYPLGRNTIIGDRNGSLPLNQRQRLHLNLNSPQFGGIDPLRSGSPLTQQRPQRGRHRNLEEYNRTSTEGLYPLPVREPQSRGSREDLRYGEGVPFGQREEVVMGNSRERNAYLDGFHQHQSSELNDGALYPSNRLPPSNRAPQSYMPILGLPTSPTTHPPHPHHHPLQYYPHQPSSICALCIPHQHHMAHEASHCQCTACISYLLSIQQQQQATVIPPPQQQQQQQQWPQYWPQAPLYHPDSSALWIGNPDSLAGKRLVEMRPKHRRRRYPQLPKTGAAPFVLCQRCFQLLQVPARLSQLSGDIVAIQKIRCSSCMKISKFSVVDGEEDQMGSHQSAINNSRRNPSLMRSSSWLSHLNSDMLASSSGHSTTSGSDRFRRMQQQPPRGGRMLDNTPNHGSYRKNAEMANMYVNNAEELGSSRASSTRGSFEIYPNPQMSRESHASALHASSSNRLGLRSRQLGTTPPLPTPAPQFQQDNIKGEKRPLEHQVVAGSPLHELLGYKSPIDLCVLRSQSIGASHYQQEIDHSPRSSSNNKNPIELGQYGIDGSHFGRSTVEDGPYNSLPINRGFPEGAASQRNSMDDTTIKRNKSLLGFLKKGITDISKGKQGPTKSDITVMVNGKIIPEEAVKTAAESAGPIASGSYWYDFNAGFWGVMGSPCTGIIPPFIKEFQYPMPRDCAGGTTRILVNGRELHEKDLSVLTTRKLPKTPGKAYTLDFSGKIVDETTGQELPTLQMLAPSIEKRGKGYGMFQNQNQNQNQKS